MEFVDPDNGQNVSFVSVMPEPVNESHYLVSGPDPRGGMAGDHSQQALAAADAGEPVFVDGGQDYSAQYAECLSSSGYYVPSSHTDPAQEAVDKQAIAAESNRWAQCARDHGYPSVKDATVVVDNWATSPEVVMPGSVTADQLQTLLEFCPYASTEYVDGPLPEPGDPAWQAAVVFDLPPGDPKQAELYSVMMQNRLSFIPEG
jgi:hypothetical protein